MVKSILAFILMFICIAIAIAITPLKIAYTLACEYELQFKQYTNSLRK